MSLSDLTRSWTDSLTTLSVGSLSMLLPKITDIRNDGGAISVAFSDIPKILQFVESNGAASTFLLSLIFISISLAIGSFVIQFGELISIAPEFKRGRSKIQQRIETAAQNTAYMLIFSNAYTSYRLLCGYGSLLVLAGIWIFVNGLTALNWKLILFGSFLAVIGVIVVIKFARYSFAFLDWVIFGELIE